MLRVALLSIFLLALTAGCGDAGGYEARIRRTEYGVPHIEGRTLGDVGFGEGYAQAEDHLCSIADQVVRVRGERARFFGRGEGDRHLNSDVAMRGLDVYGRGAALLREADYRELMEGFAAGYNRYLEETGVDAVAGWCRGADWVRPITSEDLAAYGYSFMLTALYMTDAVGGASPPGVDGGAAARAVGAPETASNGWAVGAELSASGGGLLIANPHYPWRGSNRFWEKHLTVEGELDVYGAGLVGSPGVAIGFNRAVAWTHTVSAGERFTLYRLRLAEGRPTTYRYGDGEREMRAETVAVEVRGEDGELERVERTMYFSHHGPLVSLPGVGWTRETAIALRDANWDNDEAGPQWLAMNQAASFEEFEQAHVRYQGLPFVNTIAATADGRAWYADTAATPNVDPGVLADWKQQRESDPLTRALWGQGMVLLDGADPAAEWRDDPEARDPGVVAYGRMPQTTRRDYVFNANDSYWLANAGTLTEGAYSLLHGEAGTARSTRTRLNALELGGRAAGADGKLGLEEALEAILGNRSHTAELLVDEWVERCRAAGRRDLAEACEALGAWDRRFDLESRGAVLFRELLGRYEAEDFLRAGPLFAREFDPEDPVGTPSGLAPGDGPLEQLTAAAALLRSRGIALDAPLGELQYFDKDGRRVPVHGGHGHYEGVLNMQQWAGNRTTLEATPEREGAAGSRFLAEDGYPTGTGTSFLLGVEYGAEGPRAKALLTYGESGDPESPHFVDQTELYQRKELREVAFERDEVEAATVREYVVRGARVRE